MDDLTLTDAETGPNLSKEMEPNSLVISEEPKDVKKKLTGVTTGGDREVKLSARELEGNLEKEIQADERHQLINDAKLRALTQGTHTYDDFRQIWMGAHLKPMAKEDKLDSFLAGPGSKVLWNSLAQDKDDAATAAAKTKLKLALDDVGNFSFSDIETKNPQDLMKTWNKLSFPTTKFGYLKYLLKLEDEKGLSTLAFLWKEEVSSKMLGEILQVFLNVVQGNEAHEEGSKCQYEEMLSMLEIVSDSRRFGITLSFMTATDKKNLEEFLNLVASLILDQKDANANPQSQNALDDLLKRIQGRYQMFTIARMLNRH